MLSRVSVVAVVVGIVTIAGVAGASAIQARLRKSSPIAAKKHDAEKPALAVRTSDSGSHVFVVTQASNSARDLAPLSPIVPEGRSDLGDGVFAMRQGATLAVYFDTPLTRTRRRDKFEAIVRATLPKVLGAAADSIMAHVPEGTMASGDLVTELTTRGIHFPAMSGSTVAVWPETRPGQDGPLVVAYRVVVAR